MSELVSIITPAFRAQAFISRAVRSVISQTWPDWEMLIIADDGEDYKTLLRQQGIHDPRLHFLSTNKHQSGPNRARNIGLSAALGQWVAPLDADDCFFPRRLELLMQAAQATGLALDNGYVVDEISGNNLSRLYPEKSDSDFRFTKFVSAQAPLLFMFKRDLIQYGWDTDLERGADTIFNLRALESAGSARFIGQALHEYRVHDKSMCHATGAAEIFDRAYAYTIERLRNDGLGFSTRAFRDKVIVYLEKKRQLNRQYDSALASGYDGNFQNFVSESGTGL